jgi:hypothetical protein
MHTVHDEFEGCEECFKAGIETGVRLMTAALPATCPCREEIPCMNPPAPDGGVCDTCKQQGCDQ